MVPNRVNQFERREIAVGDENKPAI